MPKWTGYIGHESDVWRTLSLCFGCYTKRNISSELIQEMFKFNQSILRPIHVYAYLYNGKNIWFVCVHDILSLKENNTLIFTES